MSDQKQYKTGTAFRAALEQRNSDLAPAPFIFWFRKRVTQRQQWALRNGKKPYTAEQIAEYLAHMNQPLSDTSAYLLNCLADPRYKILNMTDGKDAGQKPAEVMTSIKNVCGGADSIVLQLTPTRSTTHAHSRAR